MKGFGNRFTTIKGVSDRRRLPRLGKIRLGIKVQKTTGTGAKKKTVEYPKEVDYFVVPPEVEAVFGKKPKELDIMIPVSDMSIIFSQAYKWYGKSKGVKCVGDGENATRNVDGEFKNVKCPCENLKTADNPKGACSMVAHFLFILPKVNMGGVYQIDTGSYHSIIDIQSGLEYSAELFQSATGVWRFSMIPLKLKRVERETHGSGRKEKHYTMMVEMAMTIDQLNESGQNTKFIQGGSSQFLLDPPKISESNEDIYDDVEEKIPPEFTDVTSEEQKKTDELKKDEPKRVVETDPMKMDRNTLVDWLKDQRGKKYDDKEYDQTKNHLFGNTPFKNITLKMFQDLYDKLELSALKPTAKKDSK